MISPHPPPALPIPRVAGTGWFLGGCLRSGHTLGAGRGVCRASIPIPALMGTAAQGGDLAEGVGSSCCFFSFFLLLRALAGISTARAWACTPLAFLSPFPLLAGSGVTVPSRLSAAPFHHPCHCLGPIFLQSSWKKGRFEQPNPTHFLPLPSAFFPSSLP